MLLRGPRDCVDTSSVLIWGAGKNAVTSRQPCCFGDDSARRCGRQHRRRPLRAWAFALGRAVEVTVDGGAWDAEDVGDLLHGVLAGVVKSLGECYLVGVQPRPSAAVAS